MKRIALFSPTGYIGSLLREYLLKDKDIELFNITRKSCLDEVYGEYDLMIYSAATANGETLKLIQDNVMAVVSNIDFCKKHNVKRIIYLSTDSIYGELNTDEVSENNVVMVNPNFYGTTKYLAEKIIIESGIPYYILRMPGVVGRVWRSTYFYRLIDKIDNRETVTLYNAQREFNNVLDIDDLMRFVMLLCDCGGNKSEIFLMGNTKKEKLEKVVQYIKKLCRSDSEIKVVNGKDKRYFTLNVDKAVAYGYSSKSIWSIIDELYAIKKS